MSQRKEIKGEKIRWIQIANPTDVQMDDLLKEFNLHPSDIRDTLGPLQRPKLIEHKDTIFGILLFPVFKKKRNDVVSSEFDFFIGDNVLITIHKNNLTRLNEFFRELENNKELRQKHMKHVPALLFEILSRQYIACFPMLNKLGNDIEKLENQIFSIHKRTLIKDILSLKKNIVSFRLMMQTHKRVIKKLMTTPKELLPKMSFSHNFNELIEYTIDIWNYLESFKDAINAIHESHQSIASTTLSQIMKLLTIFSVIIFPLTLFVATFSMNASYTPIVSTPYGFYKIIGLMAVITTTMLYFFKRKKWL